MTSVTGSAAAPRSTTLERTVREYVRAVGGGLFVGLPLLFTMEVWWHAFLLPWWKILLLLGVSTVIVVGYNAMTGFRADHSRLEVLLDSVESLGLAIVTATVALLILDRIELGTTSLRDAAGKIALETIPIAFGVSLARASFGGAEDEEEDEEGPGAVGPLGRLFVAAGGALLFALNVAPTEEPMMLGIESPPGLVLAAVAASFLVTLAIVHYAHADRSDRVGGLDRGRSPLSHPLGETTAAYAVSLLVALGLLWAFGRTEGVSARAVAAETVLLGVVAAFGGAAGRLLVAPSSGGGRGSQQGRSPG